MTCGAADVPQGIGCFSGLPAPADAIESSRNDVPDCLVHCQQQSKPVAGENAPSPSRPSVSGQLTVYRLCGQLTVYRLFLVSWLCTVCVWSVGCVPSVSGQLTVYRLCVVS